jgi:uncharacterized protein (TIGR03083 family)
MSEPTIELLATEWRAMSDLADDFGDADWDTSTELPGWSVKDCYSHVVGTERTMRGEPSPEVDLGGLDHLTAPSSMMTEPPVAARRDTPPAEVLDEFRAVTAQRLEELRGYPPEKFDEVGFTPAGQGPYREFMNIRVFDCWMHEQDVRRALGRPGHQEGPVAEHALWRCGLAAGFVVGKKADAPDGSSVVFDLTGSSARQVPVVVEGRARVVDGVPTDPTVTLTMDQQTYWCLGGGRWDPEQALADGKVQITGDRELGERVVRAMNFMI